MLKTFIETSTLHSNINHNTILGVLGLMSLPVEDIQNCSAYSSGFSNLHWCQCRNCINSVVIPLEEEINGVEGMTYMTSTAAMMVLQKFLFTLD
jgi:HAE1 family hydrophobic/amphiphilic exporter-1